MLVKDVMTHQVLTVGVNATYKEVLDLLTHHRISGVPVVGKSGKVLGIISEKDLLYSLFPSQEEFYKDIKHYMNHDEIEKEADKIKHLKARNFMSKEVVSVTPEDHILKACALLVIKGIRRLPVIEKGKLVGIVTTNNLFRKTVKRYVR
jgi:CBS domain-containing protein